MALIRGRKLWMMYHPHEVPATLYDQLTARPMAWEWFRPTLEGMAEAERPLVCMQQVTGHDSHAMPIRTLAREKIVLAGLRFVSSAARLRFLALVLSFELLIGLIRWAFSPRRLLTGCDARWARSLCCRTTGPISR